MAKRSPPGGGGTVHRLLGSADYCATLHHALPIPPLKQARLAALRSLPASARQNAAIPVSLAFAKPGGQSAHFVILPLVPGHDIYELYNPQGCGQHFHGATYEFLVAAAANLAAAFHHLHAHAIVIGDVNKQNTKVRTDATDRLIDCDSFQFKHDGRLFTSDVGTPLRTPPELQDASVQGLARTTDHDAFKLAQLIFLLRFAGRYPYAGRPLTDSPLSPEEAVRQYAFAYAPTHEKRLLAPPARCPALQRIARTHAHPIFSRIFQGIRRTGPPPESSGMDEGPATTLRTERVFHR